MIYTARAGDDPFDGLDGDGGDVVEAGELHELGAGATEQGASLVAAAMRAATHGEQA